MKKYIMYVMAIIIVATFLIVNVEALADNEAGANGCYPTICNKKCKQYIYESTTPCYCSLCSAVK